MRYVILGAGAVGGSIGVKLAQAGCDVVLIARGAHGSAIMERGITLRTPDGSSTASLDTVLHPAHVTYRPDDIAVLAVKSQDTEAAVASLFAAAGDTLAVVCAQNGISNEPQVAERFGNVYGMMVWMPGVHLEPGVVAMHATRPGAVLRIGRHGPGTPDLAQPIADDLTRADFDAQSVSNISELKFGKLLLNGANALDALCAYDELHEFAYQTIMAEAKACLLTAGIKFVPPAELVRDMQSRISNRPIEGSDRPGGSTWQSMRRGRSSEIQALNGPICAIGRQCGVPTPMNDALLALAVDAETGASQPRGMATVELFRRAGITPARVDAR